MVRAAGLLVVIGLALSACTKQRSASNIVHIALTNNKQSLRFTGLGSEVVSELAQDSSAQVWQSLVPVYKMPADTDLKAYQNAQPGKYVVADSVVVFTPDTPFVKGQAYFVRWYRYDAGKRSSDYISGAKQVGKQQFTDLIFKQ
jgi:hypothetical protein